MRHTFSSGEMLYKQNMKELEEGMLVAEYLVYDKVEAEMEFVCIGELNGNKVKVHFRLDESGIEKVVFKSMVNILMQSDILLSEWKQYTFDFES